MASYKLAAVGVIDLLTSEHIKRGNPHWLDYQEWLALGNVPLPADVVTPPAPTPEELAARAEIAARKAMRDTLVADATILYLRTHTPTEAYNYVNANVSTLAQAKEVMARLAMVVAYLARERLTP